MIKSILVCTDGSSYGNVACEYAITLAGKLNAKLLGLHVLDSRMLEGPLMADVSGWVGAEPYGAQLEQFRKLMEQKGEAVIGALNERCQKAGIEPNLWTKMGHPPNVIIDEENRAELVILGQKGEDAQWIGEMMGSTAERVARHSVKPCMITGSAHRPITHALIAYDGSGHASQAVHEAVDLADALDLELVLLTVAEGMKLEKAEEISREGLGIIKAHNRTAEVLVREGDAEAVILSTAEEKACDLLVVGAYGHSRIREMILGSTTTHLISRTDLPVLLVR